MGCSLPHSSVNGISHQKYWSELSFPSPGVLPNPGVKPISNCISCTGGRFFTTEPQGKPFSHIGYYKIFSIVPYAYSRSLLVIYFIYDCVYVTPKFLVYSSPHIFPLVIVSFFLGLWVCFSFVNKFICIIFLDSKYK